MHLETNTGWKQHEYRWGVNNNVLQYLVLVYLFYDKMNDKNIKICISENTNENNLDEADGVAKEAQEDVVEAVGVVE